MGPNPRGSEYVHKSSPKCSSEAILLQNSVEARRAWNQRKPSVPQCRSDCVKFLPFVVLALIDFIP